MATIGKGVEYALHCLVYLTDSQPNSVLTVKHLAEFQGISESYLAKVFTQLAKAGVVRSTLGTRGGYELARPASQISFWDVVVALEGEPRIFQCRDIRDGCVLYREDAIKPQWLVGGTCEIHRVMQDAEQRMKTALQEKTLSWLAGELARKVPPAEARKAAAWFSSA